SIKASHTNEGENVLSIVSGKFPKHSFDTNIERWTSYPQKGKAQSIEFNFEHPTDVKSFAVYWYDDRGGVQVPQSWTLEFSADESSAWKPFPVYSTDIYSTLKDQFNLVHSDGDAFVVRKIRLNIVPKNDSAAGILQVKVETKR
ncbi:MAG: discoidin domain-containing protein, partial [Nitrososphaeraceae archaeon]|nr:discoidin domain-containing protein [Nitrososphaeraceae archaeon]